MLENDRRFFIYNSGSDAAEDEAAENIDFGRDVAEDEVAEDEVSEATVNYDTKSTR